jgi:hypothetical protein
MPAFATFSAPWTFIDFMSARILSKRLFVTICNY